MSASTPIQGPAFAKGSFCGVFHQPSLTVEEIKTGIFSTDFKVAFKATQAARSMLCKKNPPINILIEAGIRMIN